MLAPPLGRTDIAHLGLMAAALALAYLLPFELVVLSYAILGPAHYLTEISWLHDRNYFLRGRRAPIVLAFVALAAMFIASPYWYGVLVFTALAACVILTAKSDGIRTLLALAVSALIAGLLVFRAPFGVIGALLPTLIHVSLFTLVFMVLGACRARSPVQFVLTGLYLLSITMILVIPPSATTRIPQLEGLAETSFSDVQHALGATVGVPDLSFDGRIAGLLSFVYTYHYLNWFIKAEVIRWNRIPRLRLAGVAVLSAGATIFYFINYRLGFTVLLLLSLLHVLMEFPLNVLSMRELGGLASGAFRRNKPPSTGPRRGAAVRAA